MRAWFVGLLVLVACGGEGDTDASGTSATEGCQPDVMVGGEPACPAGQYCLAHTDDSNGDVLSSACVATPAACEGVTDEEICPIGDETPCSTALEAMCDPGEAPNFCLADGAVLALYCGS
jgi:hypothetical protein